MVSWSELLTRAEPGEHVVQLYGEDDGLLAKNVSRYLAEGLRRLDGLLIIATREHSEAIERHLMEDSASATVEAKREGWLRFLDARTTLQRILEDGQPDELRLDEVVGEVLREVQLCSGSGTVRAFGEMVGLLWSEGRYAEAERLERFWNASLARGGYSLYCAYRIDLFDPQAESSKLNAILGSHTHLFAGPGTLLASRRAAS